MTGKEKLRWKLFPCGLPATTSHDHAGWNGNMAALVRRPEIQRCQFVQDTCTIFTILKVTFSTQRQRQKIPSLHMEKSLLPGESHIRSLGCKATCLQLWGLQISRLLKCQFSFVNLLGLPIRPVMAGNGGCGSYNSYDKTWDGFTVGKSIQPNTQNQDKSHLGVISDCVKPSFWEYSDLVLPLVRIWNQSAYPPSCKGLILYLMFPGQAQRNHPVTITSFHWRKGLCLPVLPRTLLALVPPEWCACPVWRRCQPPSLPSPSHLRCSPRFRTEDWGWVSGGLGKRISRDELSWSPHCSREF